MPEPIISPIKPVSLLDNKESVLPNTDATFDRNQIHDKDVSPEIKDEIGNVIFSSTDIDRKRADAQSTLSQAGNTLGRIVTDVLGGTIQGIGATGELPVAIYDEVKNQDADFNNGLMQLGRDIQEWGKEKLPLHRQNPGKSWDISDPAWWFEGVESAASTLQFLIPVGGAVKGMGALSKLAKVEQMLAKAGANVEKVKYFSKIGVGAAVARNAENMMESFQVRQDVKDNLLNEWKENPKAFEDLKDSEAAKELTAKGRELNEENLSNYIAGQAGWKDYFINSANIVFDALQLAPLFKGFDPNTRKGLFSTSTAVKEAQEAVLKTGVKYGVMSRVGDYLNPTISGVGRSLTEGLEEVVNDLGAEEGRNSAQKAIGKDDSTFSERLGKFLTTGSTYESAFWGTVGGTMFEGATKLGNKAFNIAKGIKGNTESDYRVLEISNRANIIKEGAEKIASISKNDQISDVDKKEYISRVKADLSLDLGLRAAQTGNVELLLNQIKSPEFRNNLVENGIATEEDVDKAIVKTIQDVKTAESLYKKYYNSFYTSSANEQVKNMLINESVTADYLIQKNKERTNRIEAEIAKLKSEDSYMQTTSEPNVETAIQTKALEIAKASLEDFLDTISVSKDQILSKRGKEELEKIISQIATNKELMAEQVPTLNNLNPDIISKQAETIFANGVNNLNSERIANYRSKETAENLNKEFEEAKKKAMDDDLVAFKTKLDTELKENKHTIETLTQLKKDSKGNKSKISYIDEKIKEITNNNEQKNRKEEVKRAEDIQAERASKKPVIKTVYEEDEYANIPQFERTEVDEESLNPSMKQLIDGLVADKNLDELQAVVGDAFFVSNPNESLYARNKFQEIRDELKSSKEVTEANSEVKTGDTGEFEIDEEAQIENKGSNITVEDLHGHKEVKESEDKDISSRLDFLKKIQREPSTRAFIPAFAPFMKGYNSNHYFQIKQGNIVINDSFKDTFKTLFGKELQSGVEVDVQVDIKNPFYNANKHSIDNVPIKFSYKGTTLAYLDTIKGLEAKIKQFEGTEKGDELALELPNVKAIRERFKGTETVHNSDVFKTKIVYKGNGTVISRGTKQTSLRSVEGIIKDFYILNPGSSLDKRTVYNVNDENDFFNSTKELKQGTIYGMIESANGTKIPVPLFVSKIGTADAIVLQKTIDELLTALNNGKTTEHQEVKDLKDKIAEYIKVDRVSQFDKPVGFRVFPKGKNEKGEDTNARIVMSFYNSKGIRHEAVIRKNNLGFSSFSVVKKEDGKDVWTKNPDGSIYSQDILDQDFREVLEQKYHNIDINKMKSKEEYKFGKTTYKSYKDYIIEEEIIKTDIAQVLDSNGKVLSNLFGFNNDFSLDISSNLYKEREKTQSEKKEVDEILDLLKISSYEKETTPKDLVDADTSYKSEYSVFNKVSTTAEKTLDEILKNPLNSNIKDTAIWLRKNIRKNNVTIKAVTNLKNNIAGVYRGSTNSIDIGKSDKYSEAVFQQTVLHEIIHALTISTIFNNVSLTKDRPNNVKYTISGSEHIEFKKYAPKYVKDFISEMIQDRNSVEAQLTKKYGKPTNALIGDNLEAFYGLQNIQEFISEVMTNPNFRNQIRQLEDGDNLITRIYNRIVELLNKLFGTKLSFKEVDNLKSVVNKIKNFVDNTSSISESINLDIVAYKLQDKFDNEFSREEITEILNTVEGVILNVVKNKKIDLQDSFEDLENDDRRGVRDLVSEALSKYTNELCPESCKAKMEKVLRHDRTFIDEAMTRINKNFKIASSYDLENIKDTQEVSKEWNDLAAQQVSSQDTVTNQIKMFVKMTPELSSLNTTYDKQGRPIWHRKKSTTTGMNKYVDFNTIYPYMVRNLIGAKTPAEIISRMDKMAKVYPSFAYMSDALTRDSNLLAQIESNMARKYSYDSYVTFLSAYDEGLVVRVDNEAKATRHDILLANQWVNNINRIIDSLDTPDKKKEFSDKVSKQYMSIVQLRDNFESNVDKITELTYEFANVLGVNLSLSAIEAQLKTARNWNDFKILKTLEYVFSDINSGKKSNSFGNLNYLADIESIFTFDIVENSVLSIDGKPLYTIRNPHFISNWFSLVKSETAEGKQEFEELLRNYAEVPDMQLSNWLWNQKDKEGFLNYDIVDGKKVIKNINWDFANKFNFHNFGGAKETTTRTVQQYTDFSDKDWMMINLFNHIQGSKRKGFIQVPALVPSDSGSMFTLEVPKIPLKKDEYYNKKLNKNSVLYQAVSNTVRQEIRRIQQATSQVFDVIDNKLVVKKDLDINSLQQFFHYGKEIMYNEDGTIDLQSTLLDENGKPKGKAFAFQNMSVKRGEKIVTLNDVDGIFINHHLEVGEVSQSVIDKIKNFTDEFITQQVERGINNYRTLQTNVAEKHDSIGNGSFEDLVAEYVLNQYIANVEQFNLFNGVIAEYKDKVDTNKRAKQMFAPGVALSVESMKMKLHNGSFSDGRTFRAVTIADVNTVSHTIDFIISKVKDGLVKERKGTYDLTEVRKFNNSHLIKKKPVSQLEKDVYKIIKGYLKINAGDAQGYITVDRYEAILRGLGRWNKEYQDTFESIRSGKQLTSSQIKTLQPIKGFYYGREYDRMLNRFSSNQIKYSSIPLIPQLVAGSSMEKLIDKMNKDSIDEVFFESAHKVGAKRIYKIHNEDGTINDKELKSISPTTYLNKNWQLQLDVPEHLVDTENLLATQIAKLVIANIHDDTSYTVGDSKMNGKELKKHYFDVLNTNIIESANKLLDDLGVVKTDEGFVISNSEIQDTLIKEIEKRGLSENYRTAIELDGKGNFKLPLFANNMSYKWEAILTSLFTNRIINQKLPGSSAVLASRLFLDNKIEQSKYDNEGIEWIKDREKTLKSYRDENGIQVVEVLLGAWTKKLYKDGKRISINEVPDSIRTMMGYRIPTEKKSSMFVFKVVGFLPEESKGTIITPDDLINQAGWDFDVDKVFTMLKDFYINDEGKFIVPTYGKENSEFNDLMEERKKLLTEQATTDEDKKFLQDRLKNFPNVFESEMVSSVGAEQEIESRIVQIGKRLRTLGEEIDGKFEFKKDFSSREARNNEIFDIYHSILTNEAHLKETFTPSGFDGFIELADEINEIFGEGDNNINPLTEEGQRTFRKRNISGRALKGIAANFNSFGAVAQHTKMYLGDSVAFKFKFDLTKYDKKSLSKRYKDDIEFKDGFAYVKFKNLGFAPDDSYLNIDGDLILEKASQGIAAAVDIVKNPTFDAFNATTYTYPIFHTMLLTGVPDRLAGMFIRQPIVKRLNDYYFDNKSLLGDKTGNQIETIKRFYQTHLYTSLVKLDKNKKVTDLQKTLDRRKKADVNINTLDRKFLVYVKREDTEKILGYNPDDLHVFSVEELKEQLEIGSKGLSKLSTEKRIDFYTKQLMILEYFNKYKKAGEGVQDILQVTKVDGLGAGPTMMVTNELNRKISDLRMDERVFIDGEPAVNKIYPGDDTSVYSPLETYLNYGNRLSVDVLKSLFIQQSNSFKSVLSNISSALNRTLDEEDTKNINKFLGTSLLQDFNRFDTIDKLRVLGINKEVNSNINLPFVEFKELSVANKVTILQSKNSDYLKENSQHVLNFLITKLDKDQIEENGYHKIDVVFYKNEFTDDNLSDSILKMYDSGNEFEKNLAEDLINYSFVSNGLTFGLNSFAKVIPNELLNKWGLGDYLYKMQEFANQGEILTGKTTIDLFFRNNWNNSNIVPTVKTRWHYKTDENGKRFIVQDEDNEPTTIDNSPNWSTDNGIIEVNEKRFKNLDNNVRNSPYVLVYEKSGSKLFKKFSTQVETDENYGLYNEVDNFNGSTFYYQVDRLGKDGINEFDTKSMFKDNKSNFNETDLVIKLEEILNKMNIKKVNDKLDVDNIDDSTLDDKINECGY